MCRHPRETWIATGRHFDGGEFFYCPKCKRDVALIG